MANGYNRLDLKATRVNQVEIGGFRWDKIPGQAKVRSSKWLGGLQSPAVTLMRGYESAQTEREN